MPILRLRPPAATRSTPRPGVYQIASPLWRSAPYRDSISSLPSRFVFLILAHGLQHNRMRCLYSVQWTHHRVIGSQREAGITSHTKEMRRQRSFRGRKREVHRLLGLTGRETGRSGVADVVT